MASKALSLLLVLAMCLTVGGVYAVWSYIESTDVYDVKAESVVVITDAVTAGTYGTYTISTNLELSIDQADDEHNSVLLFNSKDGQDIHMTITFTPHANAPFEVKENGVKSELYFGTTTPMQYKMDASGNYDENGEPVDIFTFTNPSNGELDNVFTWTKNEDGTFTYVLDEAALRGQIALSQVFKLDTKAEHDRFDEALAGNIIARVTDGTVN